MPRILQFAAILLVLLVSMAQAAEPSPRAQAHARAQVIVVGTFHFSNAGRDMFNVHVDDVLSEGRQAELARIADGLARFGPGAVMVEWPAAATDERYRDYLAGTLEPSRNEVVQLGFRLAGKMGLARVHGIDADGGFPFEPVRAFADARGRGEALDAVLATVGRDVEDLNRRIEDGSLGSVLRHMNAPGRALQGHGFYMDLLRYGEGDEQPGAALVSAWYARNLDICARLLQALPPGGRAVVFYGEGHAHLLRQCIIEAPGVDLVEAAPHLVE